MTSIPQAVFWDMDGTLVDTEPYWMQTETLMVERAGGTWSEEQALGLVGNGLEESARILQAAGVWLSEQEIIDTLTDDVSELLLSRGVPFRPGALTLLQELKSEGVPTGLVTMSQGRMARAVVSMLQFDAFDVIVAGDEVARPKPFPDPYLQAAEMLGVDITQSLVIEDSVTGVTSGAAAGAVVLGIPHLVSLDAAPATELWPTLAERSAEDLRELVARHRGVSQ